MWHLRMDLYHTPPDGTTGRYGQILFYEDLFRRLRRRDDGGREPVHESDLQTHPFFVPETPGLG